MDIFFKYNLTNIMYLIFQFPFIFIYLMKFPLVLQKSNFQIKSFLTKILKLFNIFQLTILKNIYYIIRNIMFLISLLNISITMLVLSFCLSLLVNKILNYLQLVFKLLLKIILL